MKKKNHRPKNTKDKNPETPPVSQSERGWLKENSEEASPDGGKGAIVDPTLRTITVDKFFEEQLGVSFAGRVVESEDYKYPLEFVASVAARLPLAMDAKARAAHAIEVIDACAEALYDDAVGRVVRQAVENAPSLPDHYDYESLRKFITSQERIDYAIDRFRRWFASYITDWRTARGLSVDAQSIQQEVDARLEVLRRNGLPGNTARSWRGRYREWWPKQKSVINRRNVKQKSSVKRKTA